MDLYKKKAKFHKSRYSKLNTNHIVCARFIKAVLLIVAFLWWVLTMGMQVAQNFNPLDVQIYYYSLWGLLISIVSMVMSIVAVYKEGWYRSAFISCEISFAANLVIVILFWGVLWPEIMKMIELAKKGDPDADPPREALDDKTANFFLVYQGVMHIIPFVSTAINVAITDMNLEIGDWWIVSMFFFPCYTIANYIGSYKLGEQVGHIGSVYGIEDWEGHFLGTLIAAAVLGLAQGGLFVLCCKLIDWCCPEEEEEKQGSKVDQEANKPRGNFIQ